MPPRSFRTVDKIHKRFTVWYNKPLFITSTNAPLYDCEIATSHKNVDTIDFMFITIRSRSIGSALVSITLNRYYCLPVCSTVDK